MIHVQLRHPKRNTVEEGAKLMGGWLKHHLGDTLDGPFEPSIARLRTYYLQEMVIRVKPDGKELGRVKALLQKAVDQLGKTERLTGVRVVVDVDPY
jgi:primosomal protein N' (replication factor Y)